MQYNGNVMDKPVNSLVKFPDPRLRQRSTELKTLEANDRTIHKLLETCRSTDYEWLAGLSSVQMALDGRVLTYRNEDDEWEYLVDPVVVHRSYMDWVLPEGCGSLPGVIVEVRRPYKITVEHRYGTRMLEGYPARIVLHEIDHLDGILIIDYRPIEVKSADTERSEQT